MRIVLALVGLVVAAGIGWSIYEVADSEDLGDRAEAIVDDPARFVGEQVTIAGEVEKFYPGAFTIGETTWRDELLIVPASEASLPRVITQRARRPRVEIAGTVYRSEGVHRVPGPRLEAFRGKPYVQASHIEIADR